MTDDALPDADLTLEAEDATYDEREIAAEVEILDSAPEATLYNPGAVREALHNLPERHDD